MNKWKILKDLVISSIPAFISWGIEQCLNFFGPSLILQLSKEISIPYGILILLVGVSASIGIFLTRICQKQKASGKSKGSISIGEIPGKIVIKKFTWSYKEVTINIEAEVGYGMVTGKARIHDIKLICPNCVGEMEWRKKEWKCPLCRFKLESWEGNANLDIEHIKKYFYAKRRAGEWQ